MPCSLALAAAYGPLTDGTSLSLLGWTGHVVRCIFALGRAVQRNYPQYKGPTLGVKESIKNERQFSSDQLLEARNMPSLMNLGSMRTMPRTEHSSANNVTFGADAANSAYRAPPPPPPPSFAKAQLVTLVRAGKADIDGTIKSQPEEERAPSNGVSWSPAKEISFGQPRESESSNVAQLSVAIEQASLEQISAPATMGLSPTVQKGPTAEQEAQQWIEAVLNEKFLASFGDSLKDGVILCTLMNAIKPGLVGKIQNSPMPFKQMENVTSFIKACRSVGVAEFDLFETVDLFELKNVDQVVKCIHALGRTIQKNVPEFTGPTLGVKESTFNKREFSEAQLKIAKNTVPVLAGASHSVMDRAGFDRSASVTFGADAATHGRFVSKNTASGPSFTAAANAHAAANKADESNTTPEPEVTPVADATSEITTTTNVRQMANRMASVNWTSNGGAAPSVHPPTANGVTPPKASVVLPTRTVWT